MILVLAFSGWIVAGALGLVVWSLDRKLHAPGGALALPATPTDGTDFRVVQRTSDGRRARMMLERGTPGRGEVLELYDGPHLRGRKQGAPATT